VLIELSKSYNGEVQVSTWKGGGVETAGMTAALAEAAVGSCWRAKGFIRCSTACIFPSSINLFAGLAENTVGYWAPSAGRATTHTHTFN